MELLCKGESDRAPEALVLPVEDILKLGSAEALIDVVGDMVPMKLIVGAKLSVAALVGEIPELGLSEGEALELNEEKEEGVSRAENEGEGVEVGLLESEGVIEADAVVEAQKVAVAEALGEAREDGEDCALLVKEGLCKDETLTLGLSEAEGDPVERMDTDGEGVEVGLLESEGVIEADAVVEAQKVAVAEALGEAREDGEDCALLVKEGLCEDETLTLGLREAKGDPVERTDTEGECEADRLRVNKVDALGLNEEKEFVERADTEGDEVRDTERVPACVSECNVLRVRVMDPDPDAERAPLPVRVMDTEPVEEGGGLGEPEALGEQEESGSIRPAAGQAEAQRQAMGLGRPGVGQ
jgi:hypothetical protein